MKILKRTSEKGQEKGYCKENESVQTVYPYSADVNIILAFNVAPPLSVIDKIMRNSREIDICINSLEHLLYLK